MAAGMAETHVRQRRAWRGALEGGLPYRYTAAQRLPWAVRDPVLPERLLAKLWRAKTGTTLRTTDGQRLRVIYPGRPAPGHGPDFRDAVLELDGRTLTGPVELHRVPSDWKAHGHDSDPAYDNVVLHVVAAVPDTPPRNAFGTGEGMQLAAPVTTERLDPSALPTVVLAAPPRSRRKPRQIGPAPGLLRDLAGLDDDALRERLREAGVRRFDERVASAAAAVERQGTEQALLGGIMEGLGYSENRSPFRELAARLPFAMLTAAARAVAPEGAPMLARLLLAGAGLAPETNEWRQLVGTPPMHSSAWRTSGVRPSNHPRRRIEALAHYLVRARQQGLVGWLAPQAGGPRRLTQALVVGGEGGPSLVGESRAREIAVNAVLPTLVASASASGDAQAATCLRETYARFPALPDNTVLREALYLLGERRKLRLGACEQQGLLHLYRLSVAV